MLAKLFGRLTAPGAEAAGLLDLLTGAARERDWYVAGGVPDTIDGRFALLATMTALTLVRLERAGEQGVRLSVALTERFAHVMESEHRELGLGDPTLGKTVLKLVGSLGRRVDLWRHRIPGTDAWAEATMLSLPEAETDIRSWRAERLAEFADRIARTPIESLQGGELA